MFQLDSRLRQDTFLLGESELNLLLLMNDSRYPWCILVPKLEDLVELYQIPEHLQNQLWRESNILAEVLKDCFDAEKINIGALGNIVRQLHIHHIARFSDDPAWPGPVWGHSQGIPYDASTLASTRASLTQSALENWFEFGEQPS